MRAVTWQCTIHIFPQVSLDEIPAAAVEAGPALVILSAVPTRLVHQDGQLLVDGDVIADDVRLVVDAELHRRHLLKHPADGNPDLVLSFVDEHCNIST